MTNEERIKILKMVQEGKISAEEGAELLEAFEETETRTGEGNTHREKQTSAARSIRIQVTEMDTGNMEVNLALPLKLARLVGSFVPQSERSKIHAKGINIDELLQSIDEGTRGKILEVEDIHDNHRVVIFVE